MTEFASKPRINKWDNRFMELAHHVKGWSKDPRTKVGAVIVGDGDRRQVCFGYNGFPSQIQDDNRLHKRDSKHLLILHAEVNAILNCPFPTKDATLYTTMAPCPDCMKTILAAGITRVVYERWHEEADDETIMKIATEAAVCWGNFSFERLNT